jgi:hypothetical protein
VEANDPALAWESDWSILMQKTPHAAEMQWQDFVKDSQSYLAEVKDLVKAMCQNPAH